MNHFTVFLYKWKIFNIYFTPRTLHYKKKLVRMIDELGYESKDISYLRAHHWCYFVLETFVWGTLIIYICCLPSLGIAVIFFYYSVDWHTSPFGIIFYLIYYRITLNLIEFFKKIHVNQIDIYEQNWLHIRVQFMIECNETCNIGLIWYNNS